MHAAAPMHKPHTGKIKKADWRIAMRQLWVDHAVWTHEYLLATAQDIADYKKLSAERLLRNQDDIGNAVMPFYGEAGGKKLSALLRDHIVIATEVVDAAKSGNQEALKKADAKWHANAKDIAVFLSGANPKNSLEKALITMLNKHLELTTKEAVALLGKKWADVITVYDEVIAQLMMMADNLSKGIVKQFSEKFGHKPVKRALKALKEKIKWEKKK